MTDSSPRAAPGEDRDVDRYIAEVRALVAQAGIPERWGSVTPDASWVEIVITLGERKHVLANRYGPGGVRLAPDAAATAHDRRVAAAFQRVLDLTVQRASRQLSGG